MKRNLFLLLASLLAGCDNSQVTAFVHSPGVKLLAKAGEQILNQTNSTPAALPATIKPNRSADLVYDKKAVGHRDFENAKKVLPKVFLGMEEDFYCGCKYTGKEVDLNSCGYEPRKNADRARRIEWEHVVPAWVIGHQHQCWQRGGRENCTENDPTFQAAEGDLNNLVPAVGEVNGDRSNFAYGAWTRNPAPMYGQCKTIVDFKYKRAQPREEVRGRAARITLYMHETYGLNMSKQNKQLMCAWAKTYPVDDWERKRNARIIGWQGSGNPLVTDQQKLKGLCG